MSLSDVKVAKRVWLANSDKPRIRALEVKIEIQFSPISESVMGVETWRVPVRGHSLAGLASAEYAGQGLQQRRAQLFLAQLVQPQLFVIES
jgi:hypothetical protein